MRTGLQPLARIIFLGAIVSGAPLLAQDADLTYDLLPGSFLLNDCPVCDRPTIEEPLSGTFVLSPSAIVAGTYEVKDIDFHTTGATESTASGQGAYILKSDKEPSQDLTLDLTINGEAGILLRSVSQEVIWPWPAISLDVMEVTASQTRVYSMHLLTTPRPAKPVLYQVLKGSYFIDDCLPCGRPTIPVPIVGSFALHPLDGNPLFAAWRIEGLELQSLNTDVVRVSGVGIYRQGGEVALLQEMLLETTVNQATTHITFTSGGLVPIGATLPRIEIDLVEMPPTDPFHTFSIHLMALPKGAGLNFHRGDSNDDGLVDISDAVSVLFWLFGDGEEPPCLDAADGDGNGSLDLNDPVVILNYLFLSGTTPPAPGPDHCGPSGSPAAGCNSYRSCQQS